MGTATVMSTTLYSNSCSYPHSYSSPSVILPIINLPLRHVYNCDQKRYCRPLLCGSGYGRLRTRTSDDHCGNGSRKSRFPALYGYGSWFSKSHCGGHNHYQVSHASKQPHFEGGYEEEAYKREEFRWLREEQRWLREEQRWLREEARWNAERDSLLRQISHLNLKIEHLELELEDLRNHGDPSSNVPEILSRITALLQVLSSTATGTISSSNADQIQIPEYSEEISKPLVLENAGLELESESASHDPVPHASPAMASVESMKKTALSLRMGSHGEEVRALQEALLSLGFYSGEEDMEYSSFSSGTQRAVKTWQASIGAPEDGVMTAELLEMLYAAQQTHNSEAADKANGMPKASVTEVREVQQTVVKKGPSDVEISQHRVFLLGENRWEEPSRLIKENDKKANGVKGEVPVIKCRACRGEGRLLCMECDGTGEPNVEEQFLDWVEEGAKCPYCDGIGYTVCDVCDGKAVA
uniref:Protein disulfide-isomerase n=1 Tax=Opuntia streptacantha TaxID=393608 RepID=A0A7C9A4D6_OPUST